MLNVGLNMLEIPQIYPNLVTDFLNFFIFCWVSKTSKILWEIRVVRSRPKHDYASISWTR